MNSQLHLKDSTIDSCCEMAIEFHRGPSWMCVILFLQHPVHTRELDADIDSVRSELLSSLLQQKGDLISF